MAEFRLTPPRDLAAMGALYGAPDEMSMWLQSGMTGAPPAPQFPPAPPSRMDAAYDQSVARLGSMAEAAKNDPASVAQNFGGPGLAASAVLRAIENSDRSGQRGMLPLGGPRRQDAAIPPSAQPTAGESAAPQADMLPVLLQQKTALQTEIAAATKARDLQAKSGAGPKWQAAVDTANGLISKMDALDKQINAEQSSRAEMQKRSSPEYQRMLTEGDKAATARDEALSNRRQSYEEFMPQGVQNMQAWLPMATAAGIHGVKEGFNVVKNNSAAGRWTNAIEAANATKGAARLRNADLSAAYAKQFPPVQGFDKVKPYAIAAGAGAAEGAALSNTPEIYNSFLPAINQERAAWEQYLKALPADHPDRARADKILAGMPEKNPIKEAALEHLLSRASLTRGAEGALEGAIGATTAKSLIGGFNQTFPRAEAAALVKEMKRAAPAKSGGKSKKSVAEALVEPPETVLQLPSGPMPPRLALPAPPQMPGPPWPRGYSPLE